MDAELKQALTIGREHYTNRDYGAAEPYLAKLAAAGLKFADVFNMLGVIYHDGGHFARAQQCFEEALRINPAYTEASLNLAVTYNDLGKYADAKETYRRALTVSHHPGQELDPFVQGKVANMYADIGDVYASCGCFKAAVLEYERALAMRPTFMDIRLKLASAYRDLGEKQEALQQLRTILEQNPDHSSARINLGITLFAVGDADTAVVELDRVLAREPQNARARLYLTMIQDKIKTAGQMPADWPAGGPPQGDGGPGPAKS